MLEQISELVKQYGQEAVVNNPDVPNEENSAVLAETTNTITDGMQNMLAGGGFRILFLSLLVEIINQINKAAVWVDY